MEAKKFFVCVTMLCLGLSVFATMSAVLHADPPAVDTCNAQCDTLEDQFGINHGDCLATCVVCTNDGENSGVCICGIIESALGTELFNSIFGNFGQCVQGML